MEPYYTSLALYDARSGKKLTENFHFDVNNEAVRDIVNETENTRALIEHFSYDVKLDVNKISDDWFRAKRQVSQLFIISLGDEPASKHQSPR